MGDDDIYRRIMELAEADPGTPGELLLAEAVEALRIAVERVQAAIQRIEHERHGRLGLRVV